MLDLKGKWALVTGASRGVGRQISLALAQNGVNLILHSRSLEHTRKIEKEAMDFGVKTFSVSAELASADSRLNMLREIDSNCERVDIVFNNAGLQTPYREDFWNMPEEDYLLNFQVNAISPILLSCHFLPKMIANGFGRVICTTSGIMHQPEQMAYAAAKAALDKFIKDTAHKLENTGVTLNNMDPGWLRTDLGGPNAPDDVETSIPGAVVAAFASDKINGKWISAQNYKGISLEEAVTKLEIKVNADKASAE